MTHVEDDARRQMSLIPPEDLPGVYRALVLQCPVSVWLLDKNGTNVLQNQACRQMLGIEKDEETVGRYNIFKDDELAAQGFMPRIRKVFDEGGSTELIVDYDFSKVEHVKVSRPSRKILRWSLFAINGGAGRVRYVCVHHEDYTERVQAEEALRESEERYRALVETSPDAIVVIDLTGKIIMLNPQAVRFYGGERAEEMLGRSAFDFISPEDRPRAQKDFLRVLETGSARNVEHTMLRKDGTRCVAELSAALIADLEGKPSAVIALGRDITARKRAENALRESEEKYRTLTQSAVDAIISADSSGVIVSYNKAAERMFGYTEGEALGRPATILAPEQYKGAHEEGMEHLRRTGKLRAPGRLFTLRGVRKDGTEFPVELTVATWTTPQGRFCTAIIRDVTERKRAEEALAEAEAKYRSVVEEALVGVCIIQDGRFKYVNPCMATIFGYTREEMLSKENVLDVVAPEDRALVAENIRKRLEGEIETIHYVTKGLRKDGRVIDIEVLGTRTEYEGKPAIIGSLLDITERKMVEQKRQELEEHKREFYRRTIFAATGGKLVISEREDVEALAGKPMVSWEIRTGQEVAGIRHKAMELALSSGISEERAENLAVCAGEAMANAYKHAGGGTASLHRTADGVLLVVSDKGPGIEALTLPEALLLAGYSTAGSLGIGYKVITSYADKVYLATGPEGTTVAIEMRLHPEPVPIMSLLPDTWVSS